MIEEASALGAARALQELGLADDEAAKDVADLRGLLEAWRDAKSSIREAVIGWFVKTIIVLIMIGLAYKIGVAERLGL